MIAANKKAGMENKEAIVKAIDEAIKENLLEGFFKIHRAEIIGMCLEEVSEEEQRRIWHEDGYSVGIDAGRQEKAIEDAIRLLQEGDSPEKVARCIGLPLEKVLELQKTIPAEANA